MKHKRSLFLVALMAVLMTVTGFQDSPQYKILFEKAKFTMDTKGDLNGAIDLFNEIIKKYPKEREYAAKSQLYIGLCYEKLGLEEAQKAYRKVVENYPEQRQEVAMARENLNRLLASKDVPLKPTFRKINIPTKLSSIAKLSPDGKELALVSDKKLWKLPLSGNLGPDFSGTPVQINTDGTEVEYSGLYWSYDGKWIAFNEYPETMDSLVNQWICIVPADGGKPLKVIDNFRAARLENYSISLSPDGRTIAYSSVENGEQHVYKTQIDGGSPKQMTDNQSREPAFSPDGKWIAYVEDKNLGYGGGNLWIVPALGGNPRLIAKADYAACPVWSPDNSMIAFMDYGKKDKIEIVEVSKEGKEAGNIISISIPEGAEGVSFLAGWTTDNRIGIVINRKERALYSLPVQGGVATVVLNDCWAMQPRWSPDGSRIYYITPKVEGSQPQQVMHLTLASVPADGGIGKLLTQDKEGETVKQLGNQGGNRISPDGEKIISAAWEEFFSDLNFPSLHIWEFSTDGLESRKITNKKGHYSELCPSWSPDGEKIAFMRTSIKTPTGFSDTTNIMVINSSGGEEKILATIPDKFISSLVWSPDGKMLAYFSVDKTSKTKHMNFIDAKSGESIFVWEVPSSSSEIAWAPDSKRIAFNDQEGKVIKIMNVNNGNIEDIETNLGDVKIFHLDWSPDGQKFVFGGEKEGVQELWFVENFLPE